MKFRVFFGFLGQKDPEFWTFNCQNLSKIRSSYIVSLPSHQLNIQHSAPKGPNLLNNVNMLNYAMLRRLAFHFIQPARIAHACKILTPSSPQPPSNFCSSIRSPGIYLFCTRLRDSGRYSRAQPSTNPAARHTHNGMLIISHVLLQLSVIRL